MKRPGRAGFPLGYRIVGNKHVGVFRQQLEVAVVAVGIAGEDYNFATQLDSPCEGGDTAVNDLGG